MSTEGRENRGCAHFTAGTYYRTAQDSGTRFNINKQLDIIQAFQLRPFLTKKLSFCHKL